VSIRDESSQYILFYEIFFYLLGDVPQVTVVAESQKSVLDGDLVKLGGLFISEERVRYPDVVPARVAESDRLETAVERAEGESRIVPRLA